MIGRRWCCAALLALAAAGLPGRLPAATAEPQWLLRAEGLEITDRTLLFAVQVKGKARPGVDRSAVMQEHFDHLKTRLVLAAAARRNGYAQDPEVAGPIEEYRSQHLVDLYFEAMIDAPARKLAEGKKNRFRAERDKLFLEVTKRAKREFPGTVDEQAVAAVARGDAGDIVLARVAGGEVRANEIRRGLQLVDHPSDNPKTRESMVWTVLDPLVARRSMAAMAERDGYAAQADFRSDLADRTVRLLADRYQARDVHPAVTVTNEEVAKFYAENAAQLARGEEREMQEILLVDRETAEAVVARLKGGAAFADEVKRSSAGPTRDAGGALGFLQAGEGHPALAAAIAKLREGEVSPVIRTPFGWHILRCVRVVTGRVPPLTEAGPRIGEALLQQKRAAAVEAHAAQLAKQIKVEVNESRYQTILRGWVK